MGADQFLIKSVNFKYTVFFFKNNMGTRTLIGSNGNTIKIAFIGNSVGLSNVIGFLFLYFLLGWEYMDLNTPFQ